MGSGGVALPAGASCGYEPLELAQELQHGLSRQQLLAATWITISCHAYSTPEVNNCPPPDGPPLAYGSAAGCAKPHAQGPEPSLLISELMGVGALALSSRVVPVQLDLIKIRSSQ